MNDPTVVIIGAGAMGGVMAGALANAGVRIEIIDIDAAHTAALARDGLRVDGLDMQPARVTTGTVARDQAYADLVLVMTPSYETANAAETAAAVLRPGGSAISLQNGLGNAEALIAALGEKRVFMGSTRASADRPRPGLPRLTKLDPTTIGELDGSQSARADWLVDALTRGGMPAKTTDNITGVLWSKFIHNCCINALSAITGLRMGEVTRLPALGAIRWQIAEEALAVARAKGIQLADPDPIPHMQRHVWQKFTKPSMLQHIDQGRRIEIDAINGWLIKEAEAMGVGVPVNRIVYALALGRGEAACRAAGDRIDYAALTKIAEAEVSRGERPWEDLPDNQE